MTARISIALLLFFTGVWQPVFSQDDIARKEALKKYRNEYLTSEVDRIKWKGNTEKFSPFLHSLDFLVLCCQEKRTSTSGERVLKGRSNGQTAFVNGENKGGSDNEFGSVGTEKFSQVD
jgi:hypothetical protein